MSRLLLPRFLLIALLFLSACAPQAGRIASAGTRPDPSRWAFETSDIAPEPEYRFGRLENGMRYVIRHNATPKGTALVRLDFAVGSLDENADELGFAHFVEHMAFNGSTNVPEGEMVRLLERNGLAFGADTNASTGFEATTYRLDLPRADPALLDTALMLMRETASELRFAPEAVSRERGVLLSELRDRNTWQLRNAMASAHFFHPDARFPQRFPIGTTEMLENASADALRGFYRREYVPARTTLVVIGDFAPDAVEAAIRERFGSWQPQPAQPQPDTGPINPRDKARGTTYLDQALSERVIASRNGKWIRQPDSIAQRRETMLAQIGYGIVNRRLQRIARETNPPFRDAGFGTSDLFRSGRSTSVVIDTVDGKWKRGLIAATREVRRALAHGFTAAEVSEQVARISASIENAAASADTRSHDALAGSVFSLLRNDMVPSSPASALDRLRAMMPQITPASVLTALRRDAVKLGQPLIRFQGRRQPEGSDKAIRAAWQEAMSGRVARVDETDAGTFAYTSFGAPGAVVSDDTEPTLGIRRLRFANGVRLNIKHTDLTRDRISVRVAVDGGEMLATRDNPLATQMIGMLDDGGLGKHTQDQLDSLLAGHTVSFDISSGAEAFAMASVTTPRDLLLQLQLFAALISDPGYRAEGEVKYRLDINNFFARIKATPGSALSAELGGILSDQDPRFTLQPVDAYRKLTFAKLRSDITDRLTNGAIEIGMVGDLDDQAAIAAVAATFGALPVREADMRPYTEQRKRGFTGDRSRRIIRHDGPANQALLRYTWPTRDYRDPEATIALELLERVMRIELTDTLRERLGKAYSPGANSAPSSVWTDYGTFSVTASLDVDDVVAARAAIAETVARLRDAPVSIDDLTRARQPMIEAHDNALKSNGGWLALAANAQGKPDEIARFNAARARLLAVTPATIEALAKRYLAMTDAVETVVLPAGAKEP